MPSGVPVIAGRATNAVQSGAAQGEILGNGLAERNVRIVRASMTEDLHAIVVEGIGEVRTGGIPSTGKTGPINIGPSSVRFRQLRLDSCRARPHFKAWSIKLNPARSLTRSSRWLDCFSRKRRVTT